MARSETELMAHLAGGGTVDDAADLAPGYRGEVMRLMVVFVDSELAGAAGFADCINRAPGLRERVTAARIVSEKFDHAGRVLDLLAPFGVNAQLYIRSHPWTARLDRSLDLGNRRVGGDKRLNVFHYPLEGWVDAVTMNMLMGTATAIQLGDLVTCSYRPLAAIMAEVAPREAEHARLGEIGLAQAIARDGTTLPAQASVDYWYPRVAATFGRLDSDRFELYRRYGLRRHSNADLLATWTQAIKPRLAALGLSVPSR